MNSLHNDTLAFIQSIGLSSGGESKKKKSVLGSSAGNNQKHNGEKKKDSTRKWGKEIKGKKKDIVNEKKVSDRKNSSLGPGTSKKPVDVPVFKQDLAWLNSKSASSCAVSVTDDVKWYQIVQSYDDVDVNQYRTGKQNIAAIRSAVESQFSREVATYHKVKNSNGFSEDQKWVNEVIRSGTLSDKVAALALQVQQSPPHELETLDALIGMALKKEQRTSQLALEALKDLLVHNLLPDRRLRPFLTRPLGHPDLNLQVALVFWYEGELVARIDRIVDALESGLKSSVDFFKRKCMELVADWIIAKPEQEGRLLALLVNKLGDPSSKICSRAVSLLGNVVHRHPAMTSVIVREVRQLISRPNLPPRATYSAIIFLSQMSLSTAEQGVAVQLVECYVSLFEKAVTQEQLGSKLLAALLLGINRAFPFLKDKASLERNLDSLFKIAQTASFSSATQALTLISHLALGDSRHSPAGGLGDGKAPRRRGVSSEPGQEGATERAEESSLVTRFYRSLYSKLLCDEILTRTHNTLFLNLLYRSMKRDPSVTRVMAFAKRLLLCALHCTPPVAAGLVFLVSEVCKIRTSLRQDMLCSVEGRPEGEGCKEPASGYTQLGNFDALKRDPLYACTAPPSAWELSLMRLHFHPSVQAFASSFLSADSGHVISYTGDPTVDFSLSSFLNRFSYKNPKKSQVDIRRRRSQAQSEDPVNVLASSGHDGDMAPDKAFFYKFFGDRNRLRAEGKSRNRSRHKKSEDDDEDGSDLGSDFGEDAIDRFADKLADDLMEDNDEDDVPDMDEEMEDEDLGEDDDYDEDLDENGMGSSDEEVSGGDSGLQQWVDSDSEEEGLVTGEIPHGSDFDSDDSALDFADFLEKQKTNKGGDRTKEKVKGLKHEKKRKTAGSESVFATADSYADEMEAVVAAHRGNDDSAKRSVNEGGMKRRRKK